MRPGAAFLTDPTVIGATVGTSISPVLTASEGRGVVIIHNPSLTGGPTIALITANSYNLGAGIVPSATTPVGGQITLPPGAYVVFDNTRLASALVGIASAAGAPLTFWVF